jgi:hypothetical protein
VALVQQMDMYLVRDNNDAFVLLSVCGFMLLSFVLHLERRNVTS